MQRVYTQAGDAVETAPFADAVVLEASHNMRNGLVFATTDVALRRKLGALHSFLRGSLGGVGVAALHGRALSSNLRLLCAKLSLRALRGRRHQLGRLKPVCRVHALQRRFGKFAQFGLLLPHRRVLRLGGLGARLFQGKLQIANMLLQCRGKARL